MAEKLSYFLIITFVTDSELQKIEYDLLNVENYDSVRQQIKDRADRIVFTIRVKEKDEPMALNTSSPRVLSINTVTHQAAQKIVLPSAADVQGVMRN